MTTPQRRRARLDALFAQALELESMEREAFVARIADADAELGAGLRALLQLAERPAPELEPHAAIAGPLWRSILDGLPSAPAEENSQDPQRIGAWRVLRPIGRGGMGKVYQVERDEDDFQQFGALKLIRPGVDSDEFLRRFAQERRILASLNHPGIARLLDGGRDQNGRPYLVMEHVEGLPLDRDCDGRRLDVEQRVALFIKIGSAVAYAHRNLIAHRDLKPSNIIVTAEGEVKLLDFGIAKVLSTPEAEGQTMTRTALRLFTPEYAAPEQVLGQPATTATDIFQLGLLLYELLTGQHAQRIEDLSQSGLEQAICRSQPIKPSLRIGDGDRAICEARRTAPAALRRKLRGDLDNIVLKALRKEPERRYGSAAEMIEDLERWRQGRTVRARPETLGYRTGKFIKRHAWGVAAGLAVSVLVISYAVTVTFQAEAIARERDRARAEAAKARQVQALVLQLFAGAEPGQSGDAQLSARALLDRGWAGIESELGGQPELQAELLDTVGEAYRQLAIYDRAQALFERALEVTRPLAVQQPLLLSRSLRSYGRLRSDQGDYAGADALLREALAGYRKAFGASHPEIASTLSDLGLLLNRKGDYRDAEATYRDSLSMRRALYGEQHADVAKSLDELGAILRQQGDYAGAEPLLSQALTLRRRLLPAHHPHLARSLSNLARVRNELGEYESAEALYREALGKMRITLGAEHPELAIVMNNLAQLLQIKRDYAAAKPLLQQALEIRRKTFGDQHRMVALNLNDLGQLSAESGELAAAEDFYRQALQAYPADHPWRSTTVFNLGRLAESKGDLATAERHFRDALASQRKEYGEEHLFVGAALNRLGIVRYRQGHAGQAETLMKQALAIYRKRLPAGHQRIGEVLVPLGSLMADRGRAAEAQPLLREAWQARQQAFGDKDLRTVEAARAIARAERNLH